VNQRELWERILRQWRRMAISFGFFFVVGFALHFANAPGWSYLVDLIAAASLGSWLEWRDHSRNSN
jgi:hypothetical protein